jgi:hypothetical protein
MWGDNQGFFEISKELKPGGSLILIPPKRNQNRRFFDLKKFYKNQNRWLLTKSTTHTTSVNTQLPIQGGSSTLFGFHII